MKKKSLRQVIFACWFFYIGFGNSGVDVFAQDLNPQEIWKRVVEANRAWLTPYPGDIYYEMVTDQIRKSDGLFKFWCKGLGQFKVAVSYSGNEENSFVFNQGLFCSNQEKSPHYFFNIKPPLHLKNAGWPFTPLAYELVYGKNIKITSAKRERWNDRDVIRLEILSGYSGMTRDSVFLPFMFAPSLQIYGKGVILIDPGNSMILHEEFNCSSSFGITKKIGEFPEGFIRTEQGFVPKVYTLRDELLPYKPWWIQFEWIDNRVCLQRETMINESQIGLYQVQNVSLEPIDPSIFDIKTDNMDIQDPTGGDGVITGRVLDVDTKQPLSGARVRLMKNENQTRTSLKGEAITGMDGCFAFNNVPKTQIWVITEKENYLPAKGEAEPDDSFPFFNPPQASDSARQSLRLVNFDSSGTKPSLDIFLGKPRSIAGKVVRMDSETPVANATVVVFGNNEKVAPMQTQEDGAFSFSNLPPQTLYVAAYAEGYAKDTAQNLLGLMGFCTIQTNKDCNYGAKLDLYSKTKVDDTVLRLKIGKTIEGIVKDTLGNPIENAIVFLKGTGEPPLKTGVDGKYSFPNLDWEPTGICGLVAMASGYIRSSTSILEIPGDRLQQDIVLHKGGRLEGIVLGAEDQPLGGVEIEPRFSTATNEGTPNIILTVDTMFDNQFPEIANPGMNEPIKTGKDGRFLSAPFVLAAYDIQACTDGYQPFEQKQITIEDEANFFLTIKMKPAKKIGGIVVGPTGEPMAGVSVHIAKYDPNRKDDQNDSLLMSHLDFLHGEAEIPQTPSLPTIKNIELIITKEDGRFEFDQLEDGTYRLNARFDNGKQGAGDYVPLLMHQYNILPGQTDIQLQFTELNKRLPVIHGKVIDKKTGESISNFKVVSRAEMEGGLAISYKKDLQNQPLSAGEFWLKKILYKRLGFSINASGYTSKEIFFSTLKPDAKYELFAALKKEAKITGRLTSQKQLSLNDCRVEIKPLDYNSFMMNDSNGLHELESAFSKTDSNGRFQIQNLSSGVYDLTILPKSGFVPIKNIPNIPVHFGEAMDIGDIDIDADTDKKDIKIRVLDEGKQDSVSIFSIVVPNSQVGYKSVNGEVALPAFFAGKWIGITGDAGLYYRVPEATDSVTFKYSILQHGGTLTGVVSEKDKIIKRGNYTLVTDPETEPVQVYKLAVNEMGRFSLNNLPSGKAWLLGSPVSYTWPNTRIFRLIELSLDPDHTSVQVQFGDGKSISGIVKNQDGEPVMGASVFYQYHFPPKDVFDVLLKDQMNHSIRADQYGSFLIPDLQPGTYTIWASLYGEGVSTKREIVVEKENIEKIELMIDL